MHQLHDIGLGKMTDTQLTDRTFGGLDWVICRQDNLPTGQFSDKPIYRRANLQRGQFSDRPPDRLLIDRQ